jgi:hypothetical protein
MVSQSVKARARTSLVRTAGGLERMRGLRELLQALDSLVGRDEAQDIVDDSFDCASKQGYNATHNASLKRSSLRLLLLLVLTSLPFL